MARTRIPLWIQSFAPQGDSRAEMPSGSPQSGQTLFRHQEHAIVKWQATFLAPFLNLCGLLFALLAAIIGSSSTASAEHPSTPLSKPAVTVDLGRIGWAPPRTQSNREFFRDFSIAKLEAMDDNTRLVFLEEQTVVVYHTIADGKDWRTALRHIEAFFLDANTGALSHTQRWPTMARKSDSDRVDSEGRLFALDSGRVLVVAEGRLRTYSPKLELEDEKVLEPNGRNDLWSAQVVNQGKEVFLRHESRSDNIVKFLWIDSHSLKVDHELPSYPYRYSYDGFGMQGTVVADRNAVYAGTRMIDLEQHFRTTCDHEFCRDGVVEEVVDSRYLVFSGKKGIALVDPEHGLIWSRLSDPRHADRFQFGTIRSAQAGGRFGLWLTSERTAEFDGVRLGKWTPTVMILVYDTANLSRSPLGFPIKPRDGVWEFDLSPNGSKLAVFDGAELMVYQLNR